MSRELRREEPRGSPSGGRLRLLALGWHAPGTGFDRVLNTTLSRLSTKWEVHLAGIGHREPTFERDGYLVHPTNLRGGDSLGAYAAQRLMADLDPAIFLVLHDIWHMERYERLLRPPGLETRRVAYFPLDGSLVDASLAEPLLRFDLVATYCPWASREIVGAWQRLGAPERSWPPLIEVPHGLDTAAFHPLEDRRGSPLPADRAAVKQRVFSSLATPEEAFVVLNASRPARRKRLDLTLGSFARFSRGKPPDVLLCLHWAVFGDSEVQEIWRLAEELGIADRLVLNPLGPEGGGALTDRDLNLLYNACDVGLNTSMGEGWGLVSFEHGATCAPQIVPRYSACGELWEGAAVLVEEARRYVPDHSFLEMAEVDPEAVTRALDLLYADAETYRQLAERALSRARDPALSWDRVAGQWDTELLTLASGLGAHHEGRGRARIPEHSSPATSLPRKTS